jgi:CRP/FNR family transcriptional regulator, cyclic AMP receptor protein
MLTNHSQAAALVNLFHQGTRQVYEKGEFVDLLIIRKPGEILGLTWAITGQDRHILYSALSRTELLFITREQFVNFVRTNPQAALPLVDMLVDMYRLHSERILNLEYRTVRERLVSFLLTNAKRFGRKTAEGVVLNVPLRHQDIASSISATRETTGRELSALERQGLLTSPQSIITLKNVEKLRKFLE